MLCSCPSVALNHRKRLKRILLFPELWTQLLSCKLAGPVADKERQRTQPIVEGRERVRVLSGLCFWPFRKAVGTESQKTGRVLNYKSERLQGCKEVPLQKQTSSIVPQSTLGNTAQSAVAEDRTSDRVELLAIEVLWSAGATVDTHMMVSSMRMWQRHRGARGHCHLCCLMSGVYTVRTHRGQTQATLTGAGRGSGDGGATV